MKILTMKILLKKLGINTLVCPFCGANKIIWNEGTPKEQIFECGECGVHFSVDDWVREHLRHQLSLILIGTSEENPLRFDITIEPKESMGLSTLEMPRFLSAFQDPEAKIWIEEEGCGISSFDDYETDWILQLYIELCGEFYG